MTHRPTQAQNILDELQRDRAVLSQQAQTPRWFSPAVGLALASWVGSPAVAPARDSAYYLFVVVAVLLLLGAARRSTGVRYAGLGVRGWFFGLALLLAALGLYSASLALVSLSLPWWVIAPTLAMLGAGWLGAHAMSETAREDLREVP
jgi:hypothetical protein